jgi:hypothetical protein
LLVIAALAPSLSLASSTTATYSAIETIPVPPASHFAGSGGGDGWGIALRSTAVYNVFHHSSSMTVACHLQSDASSCWSPKTITDGSGNGFATSGHSGLHLDQGNGHLYVYGTRNVDGTGGVVCIDTNADGSDPNPFCGFTALTAVGDASGGSLSAISNQALASGKLYAFNFVDGSGVSGTKNTLLCFDLATHAACAGQPYTLTTGTVTDGSYPPPSVAAIGGKVIVPITQDGTDHLDCFDPATGSTCAGSWPITVGGSYDSSAGAPFPMLSRAGAVIGLCLPWGSDPCFDMSGASVPTPPGLASTIGQTSGWNGPAFVLGPRAYVPDGQSDQVRCYDFNTGASCANFPKALSDLGLLYTVNPDPQRPDCIWVNADYGSKQIQNFDAYTGEACGAGATRVLASSVVVPREKCTPASYTALQVLSPGRGAYTTGKVSFADGDGNAIPGITDQTLDGEGATDLTNLSLTTTAGLPQFLITLDGGPAGTSSVVVKLTWTATYDPGCLQPGTTAVAPETPPAPVTPRPAAPVAGASTTVVPRACASLRSFAVHVQNVKRYRLVKAKLQISGVLKKTIKIKGGKLATVVDLRKLPTGTFTMKITGYRADGTAVHAKRVYHTCHLVKLPGQKRLRL